MKLNRARRGDVVTLTSLNAQTFATPTARLRLHTLGLRPGTRLEIVKRTPFGGCVVTLDTRRVALDPTTCAAIDVAPLSRAAAPRPSQRVASPNDILSGTGLNGIQAGANPDDVPSGTDQQMPGSAGTPPEVDR